MSLPPTDAYFYFDEPTSDLRGQLYNKGIPRSNITYECSPHLPHNTKITRYTIIDANRPNKFSEAEEIIDVLLAFDCTRENLQQVIYYFQPPVMLAFADEQSCLEYLYVVISQTLYGAFLDFDESETFKILKVYQSNENASCGIILSTNLESLSAIPSNKEVFFASIFPTVDKASYFLKANELITVLSTFASASTGSIIIAPNNKPLQKIFWCE